MANYDEIGEFNLDQVLAKRLTTPGGSVAPTVAPELFPNLVLENDRPEWGYLKGERLGARTIFRSAVAGQYGMVQMYLPSNANLIAVIEGIQVRNSDASQIARLTGISGGFAGWTASTVGVRDTRWNGERTSLIIETNTNAAQPARYPSLWQSGGANQVFEVPLVIGPGGSICVFTNAVNVDLTINVWWRERGAQPGELV